MDVFKRFQIEAAHWLPNVPAGHKCSRLHGHSFRVKITLSGTVGQESGWVMDFAEIGETFDPLFRTLDHRCLNEIEDLENPTSENLARWIWHRLKPNLPQLVAVTVAETCTAGCIYRGEDDRAASV